jgi:hypothetical protein
MLAWLSINGKIIQEHLDNFFDEFRKYGHHATLKRGRSVA